MTEVMEGTDAVLVPTNTVFDVPDAVPDDEAGLLLFLLRFIAKSTAGLDDAVVNELLR